VLFVFSIGRLQIGSAAPQRVKHNRGRRPFHYRSMFVAFCRCSQCGALIKRSPSKISNTKHHFCNQGCWAAWQRGTNNPAWNGGLAACECTYCGAVLMRRPDKIAKQQHQFCDSNCHRAWSRGENCPAWKGGLVVCQCAQCGAKLMREPGVIAARKHVFCSGRCWGDWQASGNNPNRTSMDCKCAQCGAALIRTPYRMKAQAHQFCDGKCHAAWMRAHQAGRNSPQWKGGATRERGKWEQGGGREWMRQCCARDAYTCQRCGHVFDKRSGGVVVHHKASFADYPELRSEKANGICLCKQCHIWIHSNEGSLVRYRWEQEAIEKLTVGEAVASE